MQSLRALLCPLWSFGSSYEETLTKGTKATSVWILIKFNFNKSSYNNSTPFLISSQFFKALLNFFFYSLFFPMCQIQTYSIIRRNTTKNLIYTLFENDLKWSHFKFLKFTLFKMWPNSPNFRIPKLNVPNSPKFKKLNLPKLPNFKIPKLTSPNSIRFRIPKLTLPNSPNFNILKLKKTIETFYSNFQTLCFLLKCCHIKFSPVHRRSFWGIFSFQNHFYQKTRRQFLLQMST